MVARSTLVARFVLAMLLALSTMFLLLVSPPVADASTQTADSIAPGRMDDLTVPVAPNNQGTLLPGMPLDLTATIGAGRAGRASTVSVTMTSEPLAAGALESWLSDESDESRRRLPLEAGERGMPPIGGSTAHLVVSAADLGLPDGDGPVVYGVEAAWLTDEGDRVAHGRTVVVWTPERKAEPTPVAAIVPITVDAADSALLDRDDLADLTGDDGALTRLVSGLAGHPDALLAIDPRVLVSIRALGSAAPASAQQWLTTLEDLPNDSFLLPFADADAAAQLAAGLDEPLSPTSFDFALSASHFRGDFSVPTTAPPGQSSSEPVSVPDTAALLSWPSTHSSLLWPAPTTLDADTADALDDDATLLLATGDTPRNTITAPAYARLGDHDVVLVNSILSAAVSDAVSAHSDRTWQSAAAQLNAALTLAGTDRDEPLVVAVERGVVPASSMRLSQTLAALDGNPATALTTLDTDSGADAAPVTLTSEGEPATRVKAVQRLLDGEKKIDAFADVLTEPSLLTGQTRATLLTLLSSAWIDRSEAWSTAVGDELESMIDTRESVRIVSGDADYNLMANEGSIPVTVSNPLPYEIRLTLNAMPSNNRLAVAQSSQKTVPAQSRAVVLVPVTAQLGNGRVNLILSLSSDDGTSVGRAAVVEVAVNADWEGIGAAIIGAAAVALFGFGLVRNIRRRRVARDRERSDG